MLERKSLLQPSLPDFKGLFEDSLFEFLPYSDLSRWIPEGSIYDEAGQEIKALRRLGNIKALSFLSFIGPQAPRDNFYIEHHHTRFDHSLVVALTTEQILRQNGASLDQINIGIVAGLLHDIATPALGDAAKQLDPERLNEEGSWWKTLDTKAKKFVRGFTDKETLDRIIKNQGVLGEVLDIADRITYVMKDLYNVIGPIKPEELESNPLLATIKDILSFYPEIGNIYKEVGVDQRKGKVFFNDPNMLYAFLLLRAGLHREFYLHPINQGRDLFVAKLLQPLYFKDGASELNPSLLRQMTDYDLLKKLKGRYFPGIPAEPDFHNLTNWIPIFEKLDTEEEAIARAKQLKQNADLAVVGIKKCRGFDPGISYNVVGKNGKIMPFSEFDTNRAKNLQALGESTQGFFVFYANVSEDSPTNTLLKRVSGKE